MDDEASVVCDAQFQKTLTKKGAKSCLREVSNSQKRKYADLAQNDRKKWQLPKRRTLLYEHHSSVWAHWICTASFNVTLGQRP
jgi:hypothetical protein